MTAIPRSATVDIGGGRGTLTKPAALSLRRVDVALCRLLDVNEAWRSPEQADANLAAYKRFLAGGPWAPIALGAADSVHCAGEALDTDDGYNPDVVALLNDHGWYQTVYRGGVLKEPWHFEYFADRDTHRNEGGNAYFPEEDDMYNDNDRARDNQPHKSRIIRNTGDGTLVMLHPGGVAVIGDPLIPDEASANGAAALAGQPERKDANGRTVYWIDLAPQRFRWEIDRHEQLTEALVKRIRQAAT